ncbi:metal ABC transporter substrate-binding protein [Actinomyces bowdenii]|uniref:Metal ABC transporter substrate-binding protein n=1 Tax=Actinomyces bowdenii TaxID=131109 RepID=A0A853EHB3_9ACTO|nr:metal ABC transporter substrate-binding protein [Actinomyces bowdenii]MBF0695787.1 metal ABC transporter substrate-binding protein [Actinomyces bowdenii]NYS67960.1 metal ABC transporter substrate-binding protein [Actinomyces bowdenii]
MRTVVISLRRAIAVLAALTLALPLLSACSTPRSGVGSGKPVVLTTFTVIADMARQVAGEHLEVRSITKPGAEIHDYEPTPEDIKAAAGADLILNNGLGLERWFEQFTASSQARTVTLSQNVEPISIASDAYAGQPNPHAWMSPTNAQSYVDVMVEAFSELDPDHASDFQANGESYKAELQAVKDDMVATISGLPQSQRVLVTCEGAFSYLAADAGLSEGYLWPVNAENEGTPQQVAATVELVRSRQVPAVFCESTVNDKAMRQVASETGAAFGGTLYVDSLTDADGDAPTYLDLIRYDAATITAALTGKASQ